MNRRYQRPWAIALFAAVVLMGIVAVAGLAKAVGLGNTAQAALTTASLDRASGAGVAGQSGAVAQSGQAQSTNQVSATYRGVSTAVKFDVSPPLRTIKGAPATGKALRDTDERESFPVLSQNSKTPDSVVQSVVGRIAIPTPIISFDGPGNLCGCSPPDPNGEIGPNNIVVMTNLDFQIFNRSGVSQYGPVANNTLWAGFGGACQTENSGDPVVLYDQLADRWLLSQFTAGGPTYYNCVALSTTSDPTGTYYRWAFTTGNNFPDYPKYGMWPDAYYISTREFLNGGSFSGVGAYATNRQQMLAGNPNPQVISFLAPPSPAYNVGDGLLPADLDGTTPPPSGSDQYYMGSMDNNGPYGAPQDALTLWKFHADFSNPPSSSFTLVNTISTAPFSTAFPCGGGRSCIPQPGTTNKIDMLASRQRPIFRLAYRNMGGYESLVTNQSVDAGAGPGGEIAGVRWYEVRSPNASPVIYQQGTYAPGLTDGIHRWMGSAAMNGAGSIALGYSASSSTVYPSVYYTGRLDGDPLGQMTQGEGSIKDGTGSQTGSQRWGDYTDLTVDPVDDCTFWYVNEYVPTTSSIGWRVRVGSFQFGSCPGQVTNTPTSTSTPTNTATYTPTNTSTNTPTATDTPVSTDTPTETATTTPSETSVATETATSVATETGVATQTGTAVATETGVATSTGTSVATETSTSVVGSPTATATECVMNFSDVQPSDYFYNDVKCVYCLGAVSGYADGTFRPFNNTTRGQMTKIIVIALRIPIATPTGTGSTFSDVPRGSAFFDYVETAAANQIVSGYGDGTFRPNTFVTRGQLSKIDAVAATVVYGWALLNPADPTFTDVDPQNPFYTYIETVACHGVVSGYADGTFRWGNNAIRAQIAKIVCNTSQNPPDQCTGTPTR